MKAGAQLSNAEKWMREAESWKRKAERLAGELIEVTRERDELQDTLDHIAELAAPERGLDSERLERATRMLEMLMSRAGFAPGDIPAEPRGQADDGDEENEEEAERRAEHEDDEEDEEEESARHHV